MYTSSLLQCIHLHLYLSLPSISLSLVATFHSPCSISVFSPYLFFYYFLSLLFSRILPFLFPNLFLFLLPYIFLASFCLSFFSVLLPIIKYPPPPFVLSSCPLCDPYPSPSFSLLAHYDSRPPPSHFRFLFGPLMFPFLTLFLYVLYSCPLPCSPPPLYSFPLLPPMFHHPLSP